MGSVTDFARARREGRPISMVTAYDATSARLIAQTPIDAVLVGDSGAMVMAGYPSTVQASLELMVGFTAAVARGLGGEKFLVADLPFPLHRMGLEVAMRSVDALMKAGAQAVKVEGWAGHGEIIAHIVASGVPVMGHLGLTPQSVNQLGGYRVQAREAAAAAVLESEAKALEAAGAFAVVFECIPAALATAVTQALQIPTIGIGSGVGCSGQILVWQDLLGLNDGFRPKFLRTFMDGADLVKDALTRYDAEVKTATFPSDAESFH